MHNLWRRPLVMAAMMGTGLIVIVVMLYLLSSPPSQTKQPRYAMITVRSTDVPTPAGDSPKAERPLNLALTPQEDALGPDHPDVAQKLNNLAELYHAQGQHTQAESLLKRVLAIGEKTLGPEHPNVATTLNNLGLLYQVQGQYAQAQPLLLRALAGARAWPDSPRGGSEPQQPRRALPCPETLCTGKVAVPTGAGDLGKGDGGRSSPRGGVPQ